MMLGADRIKDFTRIVTDAFGTEKVYLTIAPSDGECSTFASDNIENLNPWWLVQCAKLRSGKINQIGIELRVFDDDRRVDKIGPNGPISLPTKDIYTFLCTAQGLFGFGEEDCASFAEDPQEAGVRYQDSRSLVDIQ